MKKNFLFPALALFLCTHAAFALSLDEAKAKGYLGETPSGYLDTVSPSAPGEAVAVKNEINAKRRAEYQGIAKKNGTPLAAVEELAGKKAIEKTGSGLYVKVGGRWIKK